jgi:hypothetical protein
MPKRIQLKRTRGWRMPPGAVKVDRTTAWGNPWVVGAIGVPDAAESVRRFRAAVLGFHGGDGSWCRPVAHPDSYIGRIITRAPIELRGKDLACWCKPGEPCHADVLLELAASVTHQEETVSEPDTPS